jgi:AcrR family transcriptional regulator
MSDITSMQVEEQEGLCLGKELIAEAAFDLINKVGMKKFSMRALAQSLGSSPMALYTYYVSKDELLDAVLTRLRDEYDTEPIPGERWDDTLRRTTSSIREIDLKYLEVYKAASGWMSDAQKHTRRVFELHKNQGMPFEIYKFMWTTIEAYLVGFIHQEIAQNAAVFEPLDTENPDYKWLSLAENAYSDESFLQGLNFIIEGVRQMAPDEESSWRTPLDC